MAVRHVLVIATAVAIVQGGLATEVTVRLPEWSRGALCRVDTAGGKVTTVTGKEFVVVPCPRRQPEGGQADRVSCDVEGAEPVDVSLAMLCEGSSIPFRRATNVVSLAPQEMPVTIQWLELDAQHGLVPVAARVFEPQAPILAPVARSDRRLLRFSRQGFSPVTLPSSAAAAVRALELPPPVKGAELLVRRPDGAVTIESYRLIGNGMSVAHRADEGRLTAMRGLQGGGYELAALYAGDVPTEARRIDLADAQSTFVDFPLEMVGGVEVTLAPKNCADARSFAIEHLSFATTEIAPGGGSRGTTTRWHFATGAIDSCQTRLGGLPVGTYEMAIGNWKNETFIRRRFDVEAQRFSRVVADGAIRLTGKITLNQRPLVGAAIEFRKVPGMPSNIGYVDEHGTYEVEFEQPGRYRTTVSIHSVPVPGQERSVEVRPGEQLFDWDLSGGSVTVTLLNFSPGSGGTVRFDLEQIEPPVASGRNGFSYLFSADERRLATGEVTFDGLAFATYLLRARQSASRKGEPAKASKSARFSISGDVPSAKVRLALDENRGAILLVGQDGGPITGAKVYGLGINLRETDPGTFPMEGVTTGLALNVRAAGYTPVCRLAPETFTTVILERGRGLEVQFPGADASLSSPVGWLTWAGSECRVAFDAFPFVKLPVGPDGAPRFAVSNLPVVGQMTFTPAVGQPRVISTTDARPIVIPILKGK